MRRPGMKGNQPYEARGRSGNGSLDRRFGSAGAATTPTTGTYAVPETELSGRGQEGVRNSLADGEEGERGVVGGRLTGARLAELEPRAADEVDDRSRDEHAARR